MEMRGASALVTGAGRGIGRTIAGSGQALAYPADLSRVEMRPLHPQKRA